ncbi:MAG: M20/M25/M40 family metallo-hydrolase, partial [Anaerolineales bacterium]
MTRPTPLLIDPARMRADFEAVSEFGAFQFEVGDETFHGVNRPALSEAHLAVRDWFRKRAAADGFAVREDSAGNVSALLKTPGADKTLLLGSHFDSVFEGGRYDGALGMVAALESLRVLRESGSALAVHVEVIDFTDEEGTLVGLLGSAALAGRLRPEALEKPRGGRERLEAGLARAGLTEARLFDARRDPATLAGYLELHIEQGPRLAQQGIDIGIVASIVGARSFRLTFTGQANHAGTTPMTARADAGLGAAALTTAEEILA